MNLKNPLHQLPFFVAAGVGGAALELGDVGFPFGLAGKRGQAGHVALEVEVVDGVHDHEQRSPLAVDLHVEDADLALAGDDLRPYVGVGVDVAGDHLFVIDESKGLAVTFHGFGVGCPVRPGMTGQASYSW